MVFHIVLVARSSSLSVLGCIGQGKRGKEVSKMSKILIMLKKVFMCDETICEQVYSIAVVECVERPVFRVAVTK